MTDSAPHGFSLDEAMLLLAQTPSTLDTLLRPLPAGWTEANEGGDSWSPYDVVGHLIHGERADWIPRARRILDDGEAKPFDPFDRRAQFEESAGRTLAELLDELAGLRAANLAALAAMRLAPEDLDRRGRHPSLGPVTLRQLLATWVAHDLDHIQQIARVLAHRYADEVGPWRAYLRIISGSPG